MRGGFICEDVDWTVAETFSRGDAVNVRQDLKAVAAYPIHRFGEKKRKIGVVSVDGSKQMKSLRWHDYAGLETILDKIGNFIYAKIEPD